MVGLPRKECLAMLCNICGHYALTPRSIQIPLCYDWMHAPRYRGELAEVRKGEHEGVKVAVKVLRTFMMNDFIKIRKVGFPVLPKCVG